MDLFSPLQAQAAVVFHQVITTLQKCGTQLGFFGSRLWFGQRGSGLLSDRLILQHLVSSADLLCIQHQTRDRETPAEEKDDQQEMSTL